MEENLFQFHLANLEHSCGTILDNVSAIHYDQSEVSSQSGGPIGILPGGFASLLRHLARGIDIRLNTQVHKLAILAETLLRFCWLYSRYLSSLCFEFCDTGD